MKKAYFFGCIFVISLVYLFLRFHNLTLNLVLRPDQGLHLLETFQMVQSHKIRLLGPIVSSKNFENRNFFIGADYYYALAVMGILTHWNPLNLTLLYGIIEFVFIILFVLWLRNRFGNIPTLIIFLFVALNPYLISHSRFIWNPHFLIPLGIAETILLVRYFKNRSHLILFLSSILWGCAFSFHYAAILWALVYLYIFIRKKLFSDFKNYLIIISGFIIGDFPFFLSEFRHNFYNFRTIIFVYSHSSQSSQLYSHYFVFPFIIFCLYFSAWFLNKYHSQKYLYFIMIIVLIVFSVLLKPVDELSSIPGWRFPDQLKAFNLIMAGGCPSNYNIAETISGDTQAHDLRFLLTAANCPPDSVDNYPHDSNLYLIAPPSRLPETDPVWEVSSFKPFSIKSMVKLNDQVILYRLSQTNENLSKNN